ncbi:glycosyltransferase family 4 protein [Rhizobium leguminosarum]|uniref:Glycosyltransferase family 4 protein n=1 Tax=Rhizobium leguminosarum TaxID=384 RepID=A0AAJ1A8E9_RHILE|nr:glycosyltransferase family 4 protein [Rhizobium leguminosarum]MBY5534985.1 glycosyltransferase family 4 protein [Rhizobium leguminosarum]MBY5598687.1 glycosyltransferase family 4 protein [Rhizobium leguminosarum]MBY5615695.1 glycosyltransferase family 4 protein [Rhizobium leguminosarum]MBY5628981.1 glycosyltransferase family 4 protein [Rhizobium leguminosarum]MBY5734632.1 glycosyltransferase family 4 protein [Rhizobium leguminosarum]
MTLKATTSLPDARAFLGDAPVMAKRRVTDAGSASDTKQLRVAIVHYWLVSMRGGEKVVEELCRMFPQADIFTLVCNRDRISDFLKTRNIRTSFLQKIPGAKRHYTKMLPLMPFALEQFDLQDYDLVLSSESGPAKGIITRADALHVCYCHSPMRYIWDQFHVYRHGLPWVGRALMSITAPILRAWDVTTSSRVDVFVANSDYVASRIRRFYDRESIVIHPPVATDDFAVGKGKGEFYLYAGQLTTYKRPDIAVRACTEAGRKLVVIGEGEQLAYLKSIAGPTVQFLGHQPFNVLRDHLSRCRALLFPGTEDFGILPVEAMASGRPVLAFDAGGARETVCSPQVGFRFAEQTTEALLETMAAFEEVEDDIDPHAIRAHSLKFSSTVFRDRLSSLIEQQLTNHGDRSAEVFRRRVG